MTSIKLLIVDDHKIVRDGIKAMLLGNADITLIGETTNTAGLLEIFKTQLPDVIIMDIKLGAISGIDITKMLTEEYPKIKVIILTGNVEENYIIASFKAGAKGFLSKDTSKEEFIEAIKAVVADQNYFGRTISQNVQQIFARQMSNNISDAQKPLSERELDVLKLFANGLNFKQIAEQLAISPRTVETHKKNILEKLGLANTIEMVKYAIKNGLVD